MWAASLRFLWRLQTEPVRTQDGIWKTLVTTGFALAPADDVSCPSVSLGRTSYRYAIMPRACGTDCLLCSWYLWTEASAVGFCA